MSRTLAIGALFSLILSSALAGPVKDFETEFRSLYADYRAALFYTNGKDAAAAQKALASFDKKWQSLAGRYADAPPPHYVDDPAWPQMLRNVRTILADARAAVAAGKLAEGHEILEHFRDEIGSLHARNDIRTFSDRMNAYHAKMEEVLRKSYSGFNEAGRAQLARDLAVLAYLADDLGASPPPEGKGSAEFAALLEAVKRSIVDGEKSVHANDAEGMRRTIAALKGPYSKFFLRFG